MKDQKGFSLIELLIVVVIIGIIAAIAIPNLLASRRSANEGSAISALRTIHGAQATYGATLGGGNFAGDTVFGSSVGLTALASANIVDSTIGTGIKSGYRFQTGSRPASASTPASYCASAAPTTASGVTQTGSRRFGVITEGTLYWRTDFLGNLQIDDADIRLGTPIQ
ncbi:MAG: prepilin-type N-terminal cleavage/methylation domain-containing protein [Chloracidobacterium sp.]|nr:prepilin-type N-terminal cleavage/methylation domain-containing protein [Chloracidobacterium sp.]